MDTASKRRALHDAHAQDMKWQSCSDVDALLYDPSG